MNHKFMYELKLEEQVKIIPLALAYPGQKVRVVSIVAGRDLRQRLISMGLNVGSEIEVIKSGAPGPFLIAVKETRLAIGRGIAYKIMVSQNY
jgi:Fe2+ transport system protein FeoA